MAELFTTGSLLAFLTLTTLEVVLGIDNLVFIAILSGKLPPEQQRGARNIGLALAAIGRIMLLLAITWVITLDKTTLLHLPEWAGSEHVREVTIKDLILILGGLFLVAKGTWEIHENLEGSGSHHGAGGGAAGVDGAKPRATYGTVLAQILALDLVFSIDSVLTAVGMVRPEDYEKPGIGHFPLTDIPWPPLVIMGAAVIVAIVVMLVFVGPLSRFIQKHPTMKMLALSFLLLIGMVLVAEGLGLHIPRGYIYFAMGFSILVEVINLKFTSKRPDPAEAVATAGPGGGDPRKHPLPEGSVEI